MSLHYHLSPNGFNFGKLGAHVMDFKSYGNLICKRILNSTYRMGL